MVDEANAKYKKRRKKKKTKCLQLKYSDPTFNSISVARSGEAQKKVHIVEHIVVRMAMGRDLNLAYSAFTSDFTTWKVVLLML